MAATGAEAISPWVQGFAVAQVIVTASEWQLANAGTYTSKFNLTAFDSGSWYAADIWMSGSPPHSLQRGIRAARIRARSNCNRSCAFRGSHPRSARHDPLAMGR
jgi:hypothetical protein